VHATALGVALRAIDKTNGPERELRLSVGILRHIPDQGPDLALDYKELAPIVKQNKFSERDPIDQFDYVRNVIVWILKKVRSISILYLAIVKCLHTGRVKVQSPEPTAILSSQS
jgi:hypothetical protein